MVADPAVLDCSSRLDLHLRPLPCLPSRRHRRGGDLLTHQHAAAGPRAEAAAAAPRLPHRPQPSLAAADQPGDPWAGLDSGRWRFCRLPW
jgi:hypothetical protein